MNQPSNPDTERAWAAGFFDGEGTSSMGRTMAVTIGQVNRGNLFRFQRAVGVGVVSRPYRKGGKPISFYRAYSDDAFTAFRRIWPFVGDEKEGQFLRHAVAFCFRTVGNRKGKPFCKRGHDIAVVGRYTDNDCNECRRLRRSGATIPLVLTTPTAFDLRLHGIREYVPPTIGKAADEYAPAIESNQ